MGALEEAVDVDDLDMSVCGLRCDGSQRTFFRLQSSQAFMIRIRCACSLCSLVFVPRPADEVTSTPSLVMIEKPGRRTSAVFFVSFFGFFVTRFGAPCALVGGVMLMDPYPESAKVIEEAGDGVKMGGLKLEDCDCVGDCSKARWVQLGETATV